MLHNVKLDAVNKKARIVNISFEIISTSQKLKDIIFYKSSEFVFSEINLRMSYSISILNI